MFNCLAKRTQYEWEANVKTGVCSNEHSHGALITVVLSAYSNCLKVVYKFDDTINIVTHPGIKDLSNFSTLRDLWIPR